MGIVGSTERVLCFSHMTEEEKAAKLEERKAKKRESGLAALSKMYGDKFDGNYRKVSDLINMIAVFKDYYLEARRLDLDKSAMAILRDFNAKYEIANFYPYPHQYKVWRKKWDDVVMKEKGLLEVEKRMKNTLKIRDEERGLLMVPSNEGLEEAADTLGGLLANDAIEMLQNDQEQEDFYSSDELVKRKSYVLNVFSHITKKVQGKEALKLKRASGAVETGNFLINILNQARSGKMTTQEMDVLSGGVLKKEDILAT